MGCFKDKDDLVDYFWTNIKENKEKLIPIRSKNFQKNKINKTIDLIYIQRKWKEIFSKW